jgi:hypothetical protein
MDRRSLALDAETESIGPYRALKRRQVPQDDDPLVEWPDLPLNQGEVRACFRDWGIGTTDWDMVSSGTRRQVVDAVRIVAAVARAAQVVIFGACRETVPEDLKARAASLLLSVTGTYQRSLRDKNGFVREHKSERRSVGSLTVLILEEWLAANAGKAGAKAKRKMGRG